MTARWAYRVGQVGAAHLARMSDGDRAEALSHLGPELGELFLHMAVRDQQHALRVLHRLHDAGPLLCQAALLHDVGKADAPLGTVGRSLVVLAEATGTLPPLRRLPLVGGRFSRYLRHAEIGAEMLKAAGADPDLVEIVAEHEAGRPARPETASLQAVDERE
jgi:putative nucleotidyltransferase with HDIG domain